MINYADSGPKIVQWGRVVVMYCVGNGPMVDVGECHVGAWSVLMEVHVENGGGYGKCMCCLRCSKRREWSWSVAVGARWVSECAWHVVIV